MAYVYKYINFVENECFSKNFLFYTKRFTCINCLFNAADAALSANNIRN